CPRPTYTQVRSYRRFLHVMAALVPAIYVFESTHKSRGWMPATSAGVTSQRLRGLLSPARTAHAASELFTPPSGAASPAPCGKTPPCAGRGRGGRGPRRTWRARGPARRPRRGGGPPAGGRLSPGGSPPGCRG